MNELIKCTINTIDLIIIIINSLFSFFLHFVTFDGFTVIFSRIGCSIRLDGLFPLGIGIENKREKRGIQLCTHKFSHHSVLPVGVFK